MKVYYSHCVALYGTPQEERDVATLEALGFEVDNPNRPEIEEICSRMRNQGRGEQIMEEVFKPIAQSCEAMAFRALPDGSVPAGVWREVTWAIEAGKPVFELPSGIKRRFLDVPETREYLLEVGYR